MDEYYIPDHVRFAIDGDAVVFMNIRDDRYSMLIGQKARAFVSLVAYPSATARGTIILGEGESQRGATTQEREVVSELLDYHLLTRDRKHACSGSVPEILLPAGELARHPQLKTAQISALAVMRFIVSCMIASWRLRYSGVERIIAVIKRRKKDRAGDRLVVLGDAEKLVATFMRLRPLFPREFLCLFDSLALLEFLAMYDCFPDLVFAVKAQPWYAHCWVQYERIAFNQDLDDTRDYVPVLSV